jgi:hypothetical protein
MLKRTLWYVCLALLCCGVGVLVVLATGAGKTALLTSDTTSTSARAVASGPFSPSAAMAGATAAKASEAAGQKGLESGVPSPATVLELPVTDQPDKIVTETGGGPTAPGAVRSSDAQLRKTLEMRARSLGYDPDLVARLSNAELSNLIASGSRRTSEAKGSTPVETKEPSQPVLATEEATGASAETLTPAEQKRLYEATRGPVAAESRVEETPFSLTAEAAGSEPAPAPVFETTGKTDAVEGGAAAPVFGSAGDRAGATLGGQEPEKSAARAVTEKTAAEAYAALTAGQPVTEYEKELALSYMANLPEAAGDQGSRERESLDNYGGPDSYGYRFYDSVSPDTATYSWIELRGDGGTTWCSGYSSADDGYSRKYGFGFSFPFYGTNYDSFNVCTNGFVEFGTTATSLSNGTLPNSGVAYPAIFPFWDDLHLLRYKADSAVIGFKQFGTYTVIEFDSIGFYSSSCYPGYPLSFEVICFSNGYIKMQYREITTPSACQNSQTVGIQSNGTAGSAALQYVADGAGYPPVNGRAVWFKRVLVAHDFADSTVTSPSGIQPPTTAVNVTARFKNWGSTTEPCSVRYQFNGGAIISGRTDTLAQNAGQTYTFGTQITTPGSPGSYPLSVWSDLPLDEERRNDTIKTNVLVNSSGWNCANVFTIFTAGPDSFGFNNTGAGDNDPGQYCRTTSYNDMAFSLSVPNDQQAEFWLTSPSSWDNMHTLRWGGACPGTNIIDCVDPDQQKLRYVNHTGSAQNVYFAIGGYSSTVSNFKLAWQRQATSTYTLPFIASFEIGAYSNPPLNYTYHTFPNFWSVENTNGDNYPWRNYYTTSSASGTYCAYIYAPTAAGNNDWLFTPGLVLNSGTTYWLDYFRKAYTSSCPESLEVKIGAQNASSAMSQTLVTLDSFRVTSWVQQGTSFVLSNPGTYYIGFHSMTHQAYGGSYLDSVRVLQGLCSAPTVVARDSSGPTMALLPSTVTGGHGGNPQYHWFTGSGCQAGNAIPYANASSYLATASGTYSLRAWRGDSATCGACDDAVATVTTPCGATTPPYQENFDTTSSVWATCWSQEDVNGDGTKWAPSTTNPYTSPNDMYIIGTTAGNNDWLFSEPLNLTADTTYVLEYWRRSVSATYADCVQVKYGTARLSGAMQYVISAPDTCKRSVAYVLKSAVFTPLATGTYYIGFNNLTKNTSAGSRIDDVRVIKGVCGAPTVQVDAQTGTTFALLTANASGGYGGNLQYQWFTGLACQNGNQIPYANASTYLATASGIYSVRAWRRDSVTCSACDSAIVTLSAPCGAVAPEYIETFDTTAGVWSTCWSQVDANGDGTAWAPSSTTPYDGTNCMYIVGTTSGNNDWLFSEPLSLSGGTTYVLEYWRRSVSSTYQDSMKVCYGTARLPGTMTNVIFPPDTCKTSTAYVQKVALFTPASTGTFYLGFNSLTVSASAGTRIDSVHLYVYGPCVAPTVTVNAVQANFNATLTAIVTGGHGGPLHYQWYTGDCTAPTPIVGATNSTYPVTASGIYSCRAWRVDSVNCGACDSANVVLNCITPATLPFFEGFESTTGTALPSCWSQVDVDGDGRPWQTYTYYPRTGLRNAYNQYSTGVATNDWMFTKGIALTAGDSVIADYWYRCYIPSTSYFESLELKAGLAPNVASMTSIVDTNFVFSNVSTYTLRSHIWVVPSTGTYFFGWHAGYLIDQGGVCVDDISIYLRGSCLPPDSVRVPATAGEDSVTLAATVYGGFGGTIQYQWYTGTTCQVGNEIGGATSATYKTYVTGDFSCKAWYTNPSTCSACDSAHAEVINCATYTGLPLSQGFEDRPTPNLPYCWTQQNVNGDSYYWYTTTSYPHNGTMNAYLYDYVSSGTADDWMFTRGMQLTGNTTYVLSYWYRSGNSSYTDRLEVKLGTAQNAASMTTAIVDTQFSFATITYTYREKTFRPTATGVYYLGFHGTSSTTYEYGSINVDDINVYVLGSCTPPDSVRVNAAVGSDSARLKCLTYGGTGGSYLFQWYTGTTCTWANRIPGATADTLWVYSSGSYSCRAYHVDSVNCAGCDSGYAMVINCVAGVTPVYSQNFDAVTAPTLPPCWSQEDANADGYYWKTYASNYRSAPNCVYIAYNSSLAMDDWLFSPRLNLASDTTYLIEYWYRSYGPSSYGADCVEVKIGTAPNSGSMTTTLRTPMQLLSDTYQQDVLQFQPPSTGQYVVGWHGISHPNAWYIYLDDISIYPAGACTAPTVSVNDCTAMGTATLIATATGGTGGQRIYQWYTGGTCNNANRIAGATTSSYNATVSGTYSCRVYCYDSVACAACDSGVATISPAPPGYDCSNIIYITPVDGVLDSSVMYNNCGMGDESPGQSCGWSEQDMVFGFRVPANRKIYVRQNYNNFDSRHSMRLSCTDLTPSIGCIDDPDTTRMTYVNCATVADTVFFIVGGYYDGDTYCGDFKLEWLVSQVGVDTCTPVTCPMTHNESEPNEGCSGSGPTYYFNSISCGDTVHGTAWSSGTIRDVDVWQMTTTEAKNFTVHVDAEFNVGVQLRWDTVATSCPDVYRDSVNLYGDCGSEDKTFYNIPAGIIHFIVYPSFGEFCDRDYCMRVTCAAGTPLPGEDCASALVLTPPPPLGSTQVTGSNVGYWADYVDSCGVYTPSSSPDVIYSLTLTSCRRITFALDTFVTTTGGDKYISVYEAGQCGASALLCNDDISAFYAIAWEGTGQRPAYSLGSFCGGELPAGTYYIRVSNYSSGNAGQYKLTVYDNGPCACDITCQGGDVAEAAESRYDQTFITTDPDGGCNSTPVAFGSTACAQTLCGVAFNYQRRGISTLYRDTDWYLFTLTDQRIVTLTIRAELDVFAGVVDTNLCVGPVVLFGDTAVPACSTRSYSDTLGAGIYAVTVAPRYWVGNPLPSQYRVTLDCACLVGPRPTDVTCIVDSADGTPTNWSYWNDIRIRWTADSTVIAQNGRYTIYYNLNDNPYPGGTGWTQLATNIVPVAGAHATSYVDLNVVNATIARRFYVVVATCQ